jgi:hypothetical protein
MSPIDISVLAVGSVVTLWVLVRLYKQRGLVTARAERFASESVLGEAMITKLDSLGYIRRSGTRDEDDPRGYAVTLRINRSDGRDVEVKHKEEIRPSQMDDWQVGSTRPVRYVPDDPTNFVLVDEAEVTGDKAIETVAARFGEPLWVFGLGNADDWLLPGSGDSLPLLVLDISDPHSSGNPNRDPLMDSAAFLITEHLRMHTDAAAVAAVSVHTETGKLVIPTGDADQTRRLAGDLLRQQEEPCALLWGITADRDSMDVNFEVWFPDDPPVEPHSCSMYDLPEKVAGIIRNRTAASEANPPWWYQEVDLTDLADYAILLDGLQLQILADQKNQAIRSLDADAHEKFVTLAFELLTQDRSGVTQFVLAGLGAALYAARAGHLTDPHRKRALEILRSFEEREHPIYRLSPLYLDAFGEAEEAVMRRDVLLAEAGGSYAEWLKQLDLSLLGGEG